MTAVVQYRGRGSVCASCAWFVQGVQGLCKVCARFVPGLRLVCAKCGFFGKVV